VILMPCDSRTFPDKNDARRLLYVALSRAKESLMIVVSRNAPRSHEREKAVRYDDTQSRFTSPLSLRQPARPNSVSPPDRQVAS
jgi:ATP-dependent exoDNAse (exonuclease V) beta subunit